MTFPLFSFHFFSEGLRSVLVASWNCSSAVVFNLGLTLVCNANPPFGAVRWTAPPSRYVTKCSCFPGLAASLARQCYRSQTDCEHSSREACPGDYFSAPGCPCP